MDSETKQNDEALVKASNRFNNLWNRDHSNIVDSTLFLPSPAYSISFVVRGSYFRPYSPSLPRISTTMTSDSETYLTVQYLCEKVMNPLVRTCPFWWCCLHPWEYLTGPRGPFLVFLLVATAINKKRCSSYIVTSTKSRTCATSYLASDERRGRLGVQLHVVVELVQSHIFRDVFCEGYAVRLGSSASEQHVISQGSYFIHVALVQQDRPRHLRVGRHHYKPVRKEEQYIMSLGVLCFVPGCYPSQGASYGRVCMFKRT